ncbi:hypothetical protein [Pontibacter mangrovi]|uniref:Uncharacterized protein n=1 Tax=Pontibacter mangrovi TaxID=2589816 RepID=A0A501W9I0_9BACT|nr:hypothetical protein [Pontibacter mangrovi]TPE46259.1 hypothetical protein FJM65_02640 [Pontibacter mangrovi]
MKSISYPNPDHLLEVSLEQLHTESNNWLSEIALWRVELNFFQRLLDSIVGQHPGGQAKQRISHFENLLYYFRGELLDQLEHDVREHEQYLAYQLDMRAPFNEQVYRQVHKKYERQVKAFEQDFKEYKKDLYRFAGRLL